MEVGGCHRPGGGTTGCWFPVIGFGKGAATTTGGPLVEEWPLMIVLPLLSGVGGIDILGTFGASVNSRVLMLRVKLSFLKTL